MKRLGIALLVFSYVVGFVFITIFVAMIMPILIRGESFSVIWGIYGNSVLFGLVLFVVLQGVGNYLKARVNKPIKF